MANGMLAMEHHTSGYLPSGAPTELRRLEKRLLFLLFFHLLFLILLRLSWTLGRQRGIGRQR